MLQIQIMFILNNLIFKKYPVLPVDLYTCFYVFYNHFFKLKIKKIIYDEVKFKY